MKHRSNPHILLKIMVFIFGISMTGWWLYAHFFENQPFYIQADPEMNFFMDSLNIFIGNPYAFYFHPGTPVQIIGTILVAMTYPFIRGGVDSLVQYHIQYPQVFLGMARAFLILGSIAR